MKLKLIYDKLFSLYGPQGWWPLLSIHKKGGINPTKTGSIKGYHPKNYSYPHTELEKFEIIAGALLTQNTSWTNVEKALINLDKNKLLNPKKIIKTPQSKIAELIKPAGYFNQKSERLILLAKWFIELKKIPTREELLKLKGIGPETADSILLYAFKEPYFIIDSYTKRILKNLKIIKGTEKYDEIQNLFHKEIKKDYKIYQEYHALLVEHAKKYYLKKDKKDFLINII